MWQIEDEIVIARPVGEVFDFVADETNEPAYNPGMVRAEKVTAGPLGVGTRFVTTMKTWGRPLRGQVEYTAFDRPARLSSVTQMANTEITGTLTFQPVPAGTRLHWSWQLRPHGAAKLLALALRPVGARQEKTNWRRLKHHLETAPPRR
ncbi:SRPBCC family protein [Amycolatopsis alkalitolerans]|uniref:SRPBCC family protein n=1 Tax=Amycolatopsis alkalitolerans TaxID=2547244 RepID=A0A5C4LQB7_9PSEU|nr:SRPBCC family protein [Amycolatopsis alkalitolerans]TNC20483.1 hypothetical protein FG385_30985 [Amycolatopsis alkalitolerans]